MSEEGTAAALSIGKVCKSPGNADYLLINLLQLITEATALLTSRNYAIFNIQDGKDKRNCFDFRLQKVFNFFSTFQKLKHGRLVFRCFP